MFTCKTWYHVVRTGILLFFCLSFVLRVFAEEVLVPESTADYGSGMTAGGGNFYAGGVPNLGLFLGQPNMYNRNDRALARFTISPYLLSGNPVNSANLYFGVASFSAPEDTHEIEITHLSYDADPFSKNDLLNSRAEIVGSVSVKKNEPADKEYSIDITKYVNTDIEAGNIYAAFRFRDITAETKTRVSANIPFGIILKTSLQLKLR